MKAVILGGNGFIGSHLVDELLIDDWDITVYDRNPEHFRPPLKRVNYVFGELGNKSLLQKVISKGDIVFHLASSATPQTSGENPFHDIQADLLPTITLLDICVQKRIRKLLFFSSGGTVYGIPETGIVPETHPTNPISSYGILKLTIEKYIQTYHHLYGLPFTIIRPSNPYGERQNPLGSQGVIAVFLGKIKRELPIILFGNGSITRDFIHVSDLVKAVKLASLKTSQNDVFNIGSGSGTSLTSLVELIKTITLLKTEVNNLPKRAFDIQQIVLDPCLANLELGWHPVIKLDDGITTTWDWIQKSL
ncbi:MAG: NAD-dependent epimerase/dehydratase family protein [Anaerolineae bacterium]|nr:NAD-dependent epimerase/dehydratase family protein [Anaerolineae bacterium]MBT7070420.1 NAD-dependent epimerase/dehydratase family protein [Anaerolineae bacterium]MBT7602581.1 NAD-dependent epimerase/dehydratase family protein [Anaerolineae bacterium]MBT7990611.1 NAD-dependent epimerase/dehydratase family protein [Anaerolineae bacterium]